MTWCAAKTKNGKPQNGETTNGQNSAYIHDDNNPDLPVVHSLHRYALYRISGSRVASKVPSNFTGHIDKSTRQGKQLQ